MNNVNFNEDSHNLCQECNHNIMNFKIYTQEEVNELYNKEMREHAKKKKKTYIIYVTIAIVYLIFFSINLYLALSMYVLLSFTNIFLGYLIKILTSNSNDIDYSEIPMDYIRIGAVGTTAILFTSNLSSALFIGAGYIFLIINTIFYF